MKEYYIKKIISVCASVVVIGLCVIGVYLKTKNIGNKEDFEKYIKEEKEKQSDSKTEDIAKQQDESDAGEQIKTLDIELPNPDNYETYWDYQKAMAEYEAGFFQDKTVPEWAFETYENSTDVILKSNEIKIGETFDCKMLLSKFTLNSIEFYDNISEFNITKEEVSYSEQNTFSKMVKENGDIVDLEGEDMAFAMVNMTIDCYSKWPVEIDNRGWAFEVEEKGEYYSVKEEICKSIFMRNNMLTPMGVVYLDKHQNDKSEYYRFNIKGGESVNINLGLFVNKNNLENSIIVYDDYSFYMFSYFSKGQFFFKLNQ